MTKKELSDISEEIKSISQRLSVLDSSNAIEGQLRKQLFHRWDFLDYQLDCALILAQNNRLRIVNNDGLVPKTDLKSMNTVAVQIHDACLTHKPPLRSVKNKHNRLRIVS